MDHRGTLRFLLLTLAAVAALSLIAGCGDDDDSDSTDTATTTTAETPDLTALPLGDNKFSTSPRRGYVYLCQEPAGGAPAAATDLPWIDQQANTWDAEAKVEVPGQVEQPSEFVVGEGGEQRGFSGNDLPKHPTGTFPIPEDSEAYKYDRNPNEISAQDFLLEVPFNPVALKEPSCMGGESGIMLSGAALFNAFDANGADAPAHEVQDSCDGHPQNTGIYHYHSLSDCIEDNEPGQGHSPLVGYALDGFGIYGRHGENGEVLTNADLDECHGHTHEITWNNNPTELYHYHATYEFPYMVGCFRGEPAAMQVIASAGGPPQPGAEGAQPGAAPPGGAPPTGAPEGAPAPPAAPSP